jgi:adenine-specific DNA-methyltransferase
VNRYLAACPPMLGGKREIAREIVRQIERAGVRPGKVLADAFVGGGSVSIVAKALGYRVHANDNSPVSEAVGKALIENGRQRLNGATIGIALQHTTKGVEIPPPKELSVPDNCRTVLKRLVGYERERREDWLTRLWIGKLAITMSTWGVPTMAAGRREWDELTPGQAQQLNRTGRPLSLARRVAESINGGVFDNGMHNTMTREDAVDFLGTVEADAVYLDPPYPGVLAYEKVYVGVNRLLEPDASDEPSEWSEPNGWSLLVRAFDAAEGIPLWVVSMGKGADVDAIREMIRERGREPQVKALAHRHLEALKKEHGEGGDELLIVAKR